MLQILKQSLYFILHALFYLQTGALLLGGLVPAPLLLGSGIIFAIPGILIITKTMSCPTDLSKQLKSSGILLIALFPTVTLFTTLILGTSGIHLFSFLPKDSYATFPIVTGLITLPSSILALKLLNPHVAAILAAQKATQEERYKNSPALFQQPSVRRRKSPEQIVILTAKILLLIFLLVGIAGVILKRLAVSS